MPSLAAALPIEALEGHEGSVGTACALRRAPVSAVAFQDAGRELGAVTEPACHVSSAKRTSTTLA